MKCTDHMGKPSPLLFIPAMLAVLVSWTPALMAQESGFGGIAMSDRCLQAYRKGNPCPPEPYTPTPQEVTALKARGWRDDEIRDRMTTKERVAEGLKQPLFDSTPMIASTAQLNARNRQLTPAEQMERWRIEGNHPPLPAYGYAGAQPDQSTPSPEHSLIHAVLVKVDDPRFQTRGQYSKDHLAHGCVNHGSLTAPKLVCPAEDPEAHAYECDAGGQYPEHQTPCASMWNIVCNKDGEVVGTKVMEDRLSERYERPDDSTDAGTPRTDINIPNPVVFKPGRMYIAAVDANGKMVPGSIKGYQEKLIGNGTAEQPTRSVPWERYGSLGTDENMKKGWQDTVNRFNPQCK